MNTINNSMVHVAMDGQSLYTSAAGAGRPLYTPPQVQLSTPTGAEVAHNIEQNLAEMKQNSQELQKISDMIDGRKLQFNVNKELNTVVVKIVDSNTNQVLKEIPSEDMQKLKLRLRKAIGNIIDDIV